MNSPRNFLRAGVELHANLARAERDTRNIEGEGLDAEATDDPVLIDIEVPCSTANGDHTTADIEGDIGSRKADAVVRTLLEEEVSRERLPRDLDLHVGGLDTEVSGLVGDSANPEFRSPPWSD